MSVHSETLLIVDDDEMNRDMLARRLRRRGYQTTTATDGAEACNLVESNPFDLVLLDVEMPVMSGLTVLSRLRERYSAVELPVILVTGRSDSKDVVQGLDLGANDYITKPVDLAVALARIQTQLSHKQAEAALRESEERYTLAVRGANDGLWDWNLRTNEIYFAPRWKLMLGSPENDIADTPEEWFKRVHPEEIDHLKARIAAHLEGQTPHFESEHRMLHSDGTYRWMLSRGLAVRDATGKAYRMAGSQTDISEVELLEKTLHGSIKVLTDVLGLVNPEAFSTASRITLYTKHVSTHLGLRNGWHFEMAAMLSQLGCVVLPTDTLDSVRLGRSLSREQEERLPSHPAMARPGSNTEYSGTGSDCRYGRTAEGILRGSIARASR